MTSLRRNVLFGIYCLCLILANLGVLHALIDLSRNDTTASHLVLIPFVTLALIYQDRHSIFSSIRSAVLAGVGLILAGVGLFLSARLYRP